MEYVCINHMNKKQESVMSPCRGICKKCKQKRVHGFTNPDHVTNPFGYLFLIPVICMRCAFEEQKCMWCNI
jgi:hypothetical protein